ncbi:MAG: Type 1 glutamine amidotransferase-like domain-containing protein [Terracoccus sp.]
MTTILLGPQRFTTTVGAILRGLELDGPVAVINSGWEEREAEDAELSSSLEDSGRNLTLHYRMLDVLSKDDHFAACALDFRDRQDELRAFYGIRLQSAVDAVEAVAHRTSLHTTGEVAEEAAVAAVRDVDAWYAGELATLHAALDAAAPREESGPIGWHRGEINAIIDDSAAVVVAGGNVRTLLRTLHVFDVRLPADKPVVAWSAGAMALTDQVVLFHDFTPQGVTAAEVHDVGLGRVSGVIALPHAKRRLRLDDKPRMALMARRFPDRDLVLLDDGAVVRVPEGSSGAPAGARVLDQRGTVSAVPAGVSA